MDITPTEHQEQVALFQWWAVWGVKFPYLLYAIPNGGARHIATARKLKAEGVMAGIPDVFLAWPRNGYHGMYIELKRCNGGRVSAKQQACIETLRKAGYAVIVAKGWEEAAHAIREYVLTDTSAKHA